MFFYEKWDVFQAMVQLRRIARQLGRYRSKDTVSELDHLTDASSSCVLNLAEGAKARHLGKRIDRYCTARGSVGECNAALIILGESLPKHTLPLVEEGRELCDRISAMLTNLIRSNERLQEKQEKEEREKKQREKEERQKKPEEKNDAHDSS